ncbi:hypothetical protein TI39_contig553g00009 [Zymoseptoria brevis]|uniref:Uncharacterized protein n=1 Tax=Zymoseptoria brevis TaxID=1047168 RepID=A0A0F4GLR5_9PEZI|nr:hypothetical protein TI39_contig553g00009 [Zymoseptoria brevis]
MARSKAPKPSQITVEISSDEEEPRLRGPLRGLNPHKNMLPPAATPASTIETPQSDAGGEKHLTRGSRHGRSDVSYNMKYHPMDVVTRPNSKAVRERSGSALARDDDDDEESDLTLPGETDEEEEESSSSDDEKVRRPRQRVALTPRTPDPNAMRYSSRAEARKPVLYNTKCHPQDYYIDGYKHKAILPTPADDEDDRPPPSQKRKRAQSPVEVFSDDDADVDESIPARGPPRKALKSIQNNNQRSKGKKKGRATKSTASAMNESDHEESHKSNGDGHDDLMTIIEDVPSENSADGGQPEDTLQKIPAWIEDKFAFEHRKDPNAKLTQDTAREMLLDYAQSHYGVPIIVRKPYINQECGPQRQPESVAQGSSGTKAEDSAKEPSTGTLAEGSKPEAPPPASTDNHDVEHASQFEEQMAITDLPPSSWSSRRPAESDPDLPSTAAPSPHRSSEL